MDKGNKVDLERLVCALSDSSTVGVHLALCMKSALRKQDLEVVDGHLRRIEPEAEGDKTDPITGEVMLVPNSPGKSVLNLIAKVPDGMLVNELMRRECVRKFKVTKKVLPGSSIETQDYFIRHSVVLDLVNGIVDEIGDKAVTIEDDAFDQDMKIASIEIAVVM